MNALWIILAYAIGIVATILFLVVCIGAVVYFFVYRRKKEGDERKSKALSLKGTAEKVGGFLKKPSPWLASIVATFGGWAFFLFAVWMLLPGVWRWLLAHPDFLWVAPLCLATAGLLFASKERNVRLLGGLVIAVLFAAVWQAHPWRSGGDARAEDIQVAASANANMIPAPSDWSTCITVPAAIVSRHIETVAAPAVKWTRCYEFRGNYTISIPDETPIDIAREDGTVLSPNMPMRDVRKLRFKSRTGEPVLFRIAFLHHY